MAVLKFSRQREAIKNNVANRKDHPTADMVFNDIRKIFPNISLGTVYRNLALLCEQGEVQKICTSDGLQHFDWDVSQHDHFVCKRCGCVTDMQLIDAFDLKEYVSSHFDGTIESCQVTFYGLCRDCSGESAEDGNE